MKNPLSYCQKQKLPKDDNGNPNCSAKNCVRQFVKEFGLADASKGLLGDDNALQRIVTLRNDVSHGNQPITPEWIEDASDLCRPLEMAVYQCLSVIRRVIDQLEGSQGSADNA